MTPAHPPSPAPTQPGDVAGFYRALGIELPTWGERRNASVRCFANPDQHAHDDRHPSTSVLLTTGAFNCHGCGAAGGAYDAAIARGRTPREAVELMIHHGLRQERDRTTRAGTPPPHSIRRAAPARSPAAIRRSPTLRATEAEVDHWARTLAACPQRVGRLLAERRWSLAVIRRYQIGLTEHLRERITIPVRAADGRLVAVRFYQPFPDLRGDAPKVFSANGSRTTLWPAPEHTGPTNGPILLCEGEPDALAALSAGLPATSVPGVQAWQRDWASRLAGRRVVICLDADPQGREAAARIARDLRPHAREIHIHDPAPDRSNGTDVTELIVAGRVGELLGALIHQPHDRSDPAELAVGAEVVELARQLGHATRAADPYNPRRLDAAVNDAIDFLARSDPHREREPDDRAAPAPGLTDGEATRPAPSHRAERSRPPAPDLGLGW